MYNSVHPILKFLDSTSFGNPSHDYCNWPVLLIVSEVHCGIAPLPLQQHLITNNFTDYLRLHNHKLSLPYMMKGLRRSTKTAVLSKSFYFDTVNCLLGDST